MKNRKLEYVVLALIVIALVGVMIFSSKKEKVTEINQANDEISEEKKEVVEVDEAVEIEICQAGNRTVFLDRENEKYRTESNQSGRNLYAVFSEGIFHTWNNENPDGKKFSLECMNSLNMQPDGGAEEEDEKLYEDFLSFDKLVKIVTSCKKHDRGVDFDYPENKKFLDYCELLKNQMNLLRGM